MALFSFQIHELVFQSFCCACECQLQPENSENQFGEWCTDCFYQTTYPDAPRCQTCGAVIGNVNPFQTRCCYCHDREFPFRRCIALSNYRGLLQQMIIRMKGQKQDRLAIQMGELLATRILETQIEHEFEFGLYDLVLPVPTHWWRRLKKGFHGPGILAATVTRRLDLPLETGILRSVRLTEKQGLLSETARKRNVKNAFFAKDPKNRLLGRRVLLIDDVATSGETASEATRALLRAGAEVVDVGVLARGVRLS